ncbi:hypothetical protein EC973_005747 [Apophysomyces ossiformis]|uniref:Yeast cell wall synthesis Kre9/Knh1-like N-terminal domain-containing protein n=1 Tax=Apophysomyces ossiformis TaxID=679940 RepID=A0A8H7BH53_9FUNG|nr:hypothetical protein EC973_005747 [Apophysomyces ossiformis]
MVFSKTLIATSIAVLSAFAGVNAGVSPSEPAPGTVWTEGQENQILWKEDTTPAWKSFKIDFMTGDNQNQKFLANVATGLDPKTAQSFKWTVPKVEPHSAIYFFMFTGDGKDEYAWTTRFSIVGADGKQEPPANSKQPTGENIPWGIGALVGASGASNTTTGATTSASATPAATTPASTTPAATSTSTTVVSGTSSTPAGSSGSTNSNESNESKAPNAGSSSGTASTATQSTTKPNSGANALAKPVIGLVAAAALAGIML